MFLRQGMVSPGVRRAMVLSPYLLPGTQQSKTGLCLAVTEGTLSSVRVSKLVEAGAAKTRVCDMSLANSNTSRCQSTFALTSIDCNTVKHMWGKPAQAREESTQIISCGGYRCCVASGDLC